MSNINQVSSSTSSSPQRCWNSHQSPKLRTCVRKNEVSPIHKEHFKNIFISPWGDSCQSSSLYFWSKCMLRLSFSCWQLLWQDDCSYSNSSSEFWHSLTCRPQHVAVPAFLIPHKTKINPIPQTDLEDTEYLNPCDKTLFCLLANRNQLHCCDLSHFELG